MASIQKRDNGKWRARYRDAAGKEHARHFPRKVDAQDWLDEVTAAMKTGTYVDPKAGKITVAAYAADWQAVQVSSEGTARIVDNALRLHLIPHLGSERIAQVRKTSIQGFVKALEAKGLAPGSVRNIYDVTKQMFAAAVEDRIIPTTPCTRIALPKDHDDEVAIPSLGDIEELVSRLDDQWKAIPVLLSGTGLRAGEFLGLDLSDADFLRRVLRVERQRTQQNVLAPLKTKNARRDLPMGETVINALAAHLERFPAIEGALFVDEFAKPLTYRRWKQLLRDATAEKRDKDGNVTRRGLDLTTHSFRHFAASALISGGASVKQVQMFLGHSSAVITLRTYAHLFPGDEDRTRNVLDAALGPLAGLADQVRTRAASI